jgi:SAM-dependent methyltransferase
VSDFWEVEPPLGDAWEVGVIAAIGKERTGYPTQKPEALLERVVRASSRPGDVVLDPFCGSGTAIAVAERLERRWIGIDAAPRAVELAGARMGHARFDLVVPERAPGRLPGPAKAPRVVSLPSVAAPRLGRPRA